MLSLWGKQIVGKALDIILLNLSFFEKLLGQEEIFGVFFCAPLKKLSQMRHIKTLIFDKSQNRDFKNNQSVLYGNVSFFFK